MFKLRFEILIVIEQLYCGGIFFDCLQILRKKILYNVCLQIKMSFESYEIPHSSYCIKFNTVQHSITILQVQRMQINQFLMLPGPTIIQIVVCNKS